MPNGGPTPDCIHCKLYTGRPYSEGEPYCTSHKMQLFLPVYIFCSRYVDRYPDMYGDWLDQMLDTRDQLNDEMMYLWLGGYEIKFFHVPFAPITEFAAWTNEKFTTELERVANQYRQQRDGQ